MNIGFDGFWAVYSHTTRGNMSRSTISAIASHLPKNKYIIYSNVSNETRHLTSLLANPSIMLRQPKYGIFSRLWRWGDGICKDLRRHRVGIYHGLCGVLPFFKRGCNTHWVVSINDLDAFYNGNNMGWWQRTKEKAAIRHSVKMAERIVVPSAWAAKQITSLFDVDPSKIDVVPPCVSSDFAYTIHEDAKKALAAQYGIPSRFVLVMGPLIESKMLLELVKAYKYIDDKELCLVMMGKTTDYYRKVVRPYIDKHSLHDRVIHIKHLHTADLPNIYQQASAVLCPMQNALYSLSMLEAMSSGTPVIVNPGSMMASEAQGNVIVTTDESCKAWADAINHLLASPEQQQSLSLKGKDFATSFNSENTAIALQACYDKLNI